MTVVSYKFGQQRLGGAADVLNRSVLVKGRTYTIVGVAPAIANAVIDALNQFGVRHLDLPMTPEKVWQAIAHGAEPANVPPPGSPVPAYARYTSDEVGEGALEIPNA